MQPIKAHYDGKVIVPDEPLTLALNQRITLIIQPIDERKTDFSKWIGLGNKSPLNTAPRFDSDDKLWE